MIEQFTLPDIPNWVITVLLFFLAPIWFIVVVLFGVELLIPRLWIVIEQVWWRRKLGDSTASRLLRGDAMKDFQLSIRQREIDDSAPHPLAVLLAIKARPFELRSMTRDFRGKKNEMIGEMFESAIENLNAGWRAGTPPPILHEYIRIIEGSAKDKAIDERARLRGKSSVAVVKYALGKILAGNQLGAENWEKAKKLETEKESELKWIASYGYFNSTLFLGKFKDAMILMADQWSKYYAPLDDGQKESLIEQVSGKLILNPILAIPRHIILAAAFNETPLFGKKFWPSEGVYENLKLGERECKVKWVESWYHEAVKICEEAVNIRQKVEEESSLYFSHAYTGFYYTLLLLEPKESEADLHGRIKAAFDAIKDSSPIVARYAKYGFSGVYYLVCGKDEEALDNLRRAASFSSISGNRFADCIFMCCHAVAAARLNRLSRYLEPDIKHYLGEARKLADEIDRDFYQRLCDAADSAVCLLRGEKAKAERLAAMSGLGRPGNRILKIFQKHECPPSMT